MKSLSKFLTTALITTSLAAAPALAGALDATDGASGAAGIKAETGTSIGATTGADNALSGSTNIQSSADVSGGANATGQADLVKLIEGSAAAATEIQTMTNAEAVSVVQVDTSADASSETIAAAVDENRDAIESLQTSLQANAALSGELEAQGVQIASVVAAQTGANGSLTLYVR